MVSLFFGLPGSGKSTIMASIACKHALNPKSPYKYVYTNVPMQVPGVFWIDQEYIGKYDIHDALILIDEASLYADSRDFKSFNREKLSYFLLHRHYNVDIYLFTQQWDGVDRKIRVITDRVYYVYKQPVIGHWVSEYYRIPYGIIIPDPRKGGEKLGEIVQGYAQPNFFQRLFSHKIFRPKYYRFFDSWACPKLPALPADVRPVAIPEKMRKLRRVRRYFARLANAGKS